MTGVGGFVEAGLVAFSDGHDEGGVGIEGANAAEVEMLGARRDGAGLPGLAFVGGAEDGPVGAGGPGYAVANGVDAAEVSGGVAGLKLPLALAMTVAIGRSAKKETTCRMQSSVAKKRGASRIAKRCDCGLPLGVGSCAILTVESYPSGEESRWHT